MRKKGKKGMESLGDCGGDRGVSGVQPTENSFSQNSTPKNYHKTFYVSTSFMLNVGF